MLEPNDRAEIRRFLEERFTLDELATLAFDLGISYQSLPHATTAQLSMALVDYFERRNNINYLLTEILRRRHDHALAQLSAKLLPGDSLVQPNTNSSSPERLPLDFIDRHKEIELFKAILGGNTFHRILALVIKPQQGKTYLMNYFLECCRQQRFPTALVDFDTRQRGGVSYWKFVSIVCDELGRDNFPEVDACERRHDTIGPLVQIETGTGEAGTDFGTEGRFEKASLRRISGRDMIESNINYFEKGDPSAARQERLMHEMGRAFRSDLTKLSSENRVVLLLDTYEHASAETRGWLDEWLFGYLPDRYLNLIVVIAGRPQLHDYIRQPRPWHVFMHIREELSLPDEDDVRQYAAIHGVDISGDEIRPFMKIAYHEIALLAKICDVCKREELL